MEDNNSLFHDQLVRQLRNVNSEFMRLMGLVSQKDSPTTLWWDSPSKRNDVTNECQKILHGAILNVISIIKAAANIKKMHIHRVGMKIPDRAPESLFKTLVRDSDSLISITEKFIDNCFAYLLSNQGTIQSLQQQYTQGKIHLNILLDAANCLMQELEANNIPYKEKPITNIEDPMMVPPVANSSPSPSFVPPSSTFSNTSTPSQDIDQLLNDFESSINVSSTIDDYSYDYSYDPAPVSAPSSVVDEIDQLTSEFELLVSPAAPIKKNEQKGPREINLCGNTQRRGVRSPRGFRRGAMSNRSTKVSNNLTPQPLSQNDKTKLEELERKIYKDADFLMEILFNTNIDELEGCEMATKFVPTAKNLLSNVTEMEEFLNTLNSFQVAKNLRSVALSYINICQQNFLSEINELERANVSSLNQATKETVKNAAQNQLPKNMQQAKSPIRAKIPVRAETTPVRMTAPPTTLPATTLSKDPAPVANSVQLFKTNQPGTVSSVPNKSDKRKATQIRSGAPLLKPNSKRGTPHKVIGRREIPQRTGSGVRDAKRGLGPKKEEKQPNSPSLVATTPPSSGETSPPTQFIGRKRGRNVSTNPVVPNDITAARPRPTSKSFLVTDHRAKTTKRSHTTIDASPITKTQIRESHREKAVEEIFQSEKVYLRTLQRLIWMYKKPLEGVGEKIISESEINDIFSNIEMLFQWNKTLIRDLERTKKGEGTIGDVFTHHAPTMRVYSKYINNFDRSSKTLERCKSKSAFRSLLEEYNILANGGTMDISAYLIQPVQRLPRYEMLVGAVIKLTDDGHPEKEKLVSAKGLIKTINDEVNESKRKAEKKHAVYVVHEKLQERPPSLPQILQPDRNMQLEENIDRVENLKSRKQEKRRVFLFNDAILITKVRGTFPTNYTLKFKSFIYGITSLVVGPSDEFSSGLSLSYIENGVTIEETWQFDNDKKRDEWISQIKELSPYICQ